MSFKSFLESLNGERELERLKAMEIKHLTKQEVNNLNTAPVSGAAMIS